MQDKQIEKYQKLFPHPISTVKLDWANIDVDDFADYLVKCMKSYSTNILPLIAGLGEF